MPTIWVVLIIISIIALFIYNYLDVKNNLVHSIIAKGTCSLLFVIMGIFCLQRAENSSYSTLILTGLIIGAIADIVLDLSGFTKKYQMEVFTIGAILFFTGHIFYSTALVKQNTAIVIKALIITAVIALIVLPIVYHNTKMNLWQRIASPIYLLIVAFVIGCSVMLAYESGGALGYILFAIASTSFLTSDTVLVISSFGNQRSHLRNSIILFTYYIAQFIIANTMLLIS